MSTQPASTMAKKRCVLGTALLRGQGPSLRSWSPPPAPIVPQSASGLRDRKWTPVEFSQT